MNLHADLRLSCRCCWRFSSSGVWRCVIGFVVHSGLKDCCGFCAGSCGPTKLLLYYWYVCYKFFQDMFIVHFHCFLHHLFPLCGLDIRARAVQINMQHCIYLTLLHICLDGGVRDIVQNLRSFTLWWFFLSLVGTSGFWFSPWMQNLCFLSSWGLVATLAQLHCSAVSLHLILGSRAPPPPQRN
jgi:hypothetical protein